MSQIDLAHLICSQPIAVQRLDQPASAEGREAEPVPETGSRYWLVCSQLDGRTKGTEGFSRQLMLLLVSTHHCLLHQQEAVVGCYSQLFKAVDRL